MIVIATAEAQMDDIMELVNGDPSSVFNMTEISKPLSQRLAEHIENILTSTLIYAKFF